LAAPASTGRPRFDIGEIARQHRVALEAATPLETAQRRVLSALAQCRTAALGGHVDHCQSCGYQRPAYNSCRNRHCPKCQGLAQENWIDARAERLLPVRHFHVVLTLPAELRPLAMANRRAVFDALFASANATLQELSLSRLGGTLGATLVLHTWTRDLRFHPHIHAIVTAGALSSDGQRWAPSGKTFLFPVKVIGALLRGKMIARLRQLHDDGELSAGEDFDEVLRAAAQPKSWHVYVKAPFRKVEHVLKYLGRYTHRVGISNSRLLDVTPAQIVFRTKGTKTATLTPIEFLRRFLLHVLPDGFVKIRHVGLYSGAHFARKYPVARALLSRRPPSAPTHAVVAVDWRDQLQQLTGHNPSVCPTCGGPLLSLSLPAPMAQGPP
jgi:hypothetical protein